MKKLLLLAALLAMVVLATLPAIAAANGNDKHNDNNHNNNNHHNNNGGGNGGGTEISQDNEQDVESGDSAQNINVTGSGDNSNACQGVQGISNTGNATNQTSVLQYANDNPDVEIDDSGNFEISPTSTTTCDQRVNQAASASG